MLSGIFFLPFANAAETMEELKRRCAEQELQIEALEVELRQLRHDLGREREGVTHAEETVAAVSRRDDPSASLAGDATHEVQAGESLTKIARKHGTTVEALQELNQLDDPSLIMVGQRLRLPRGERAEVAEGTEKSAVTERRTHIVKEGETFYRIARIYDVDPELLMQANADIDPRQLRMDREIVVPQAATSSDVVEAPKKPAKADDATNQSSAAAKPLSDSGTQTVMNHRRIVKVQIDEPIRFGDFAAKYSMDPERLNRLNGLDLASNRLLKEGSSLYVSAQPVE